MTTIHTALINYNFRMLSVSGMASRKGNKDGFEDIQSIIDEEDQSFQMNGIIVEPKYDINEDDRKNRK